MGEVVMFRLRCRFLDKVSRPLACPDPTSSNPVPFTLEHLLPELMPHTSKWQSLGEALSLDEDQLDEIYTNNETDEACLQEMLEHYLLRSDMNHSWEEIETALEKINKKPGEFLHIP